VRADPLRLGVNYTPSQNWFHHWLDLDLGAVGADLDAVAGLGMDHVRIFPLWNLLQPNRTLIRTRGIDDVLAVVDAAAARGLDTAVDVLQGHLSSFDFLPAWVSTWHRRNVFTDHEVVAAQAELTRVLARELVDRPHAIGLTLGNEFGQFAASRHPEPNELTVQQAGAWLGTLLGAARQVWPDGLHTHCFDDDLWFVEDHPFTPRHAVEHGDMTTVHSWIFTGVADRYGAGHPALSLFAAYLVELATAWSPQTGRPVWLQEVGAPAPQVPAAEVPGFLDSTLTALASVPELWGVTWWCSHDVTRALADFPELEHTLGLLGPDNRPKPAGERFAEIAPRMRATAPARSADRPGLVLELEDEAAGIGRSRSSPAGDLFDRWLALRLAGADPAIVLGSRVGDPSYLSTRGVASCIRP